MKKTLSLLLVLAMVLSSFTAFAGADTVAAEVKTHTPFMQGVGGNKFAADKDITRQEVAVTISRALKLEGGKLDFNDANEIADWAKDGVAALQKAGIVKGNQKGNFNPEAEIDRASLAAMLVRAYENINEEIEVKDISFEDVKGNEWYAEEVKKAASIGIVKGNGKGNFNPTDKATRAEIAIMVNRLLGLDKVEGVDKLETKFDDADKWPNWAKEAILVATTGFDYKVEDGKVVVVTEDEEVKVEELEAVIAKAEKAAEDAVVGEKDGNYPQEAVDALKAAIKDAKAVLENKEATQEEVDKAAEELTAAIKTFEEKVVVVEELKVVEVSAINAKEIKVVFNNEMDATTTEAGIVVNEAGKESMTATSELQKDKKTVIVTLDDSNLLQNKKGYDVIVKNTAETVKGETLEKNYVYTFQFNDVEKPTVKEIKVQEDGKLLVQFSEKVNNDAVFHINGSVVSGTQDSDDASKYTVVVPSTVKPGENIQIIVSKATDYATNKMNIYTTSLKYNYTVNAPKVTKLAAKDESVIELEFSKDVTALTATNVEVLLNGVALEAADYTLAKDLDDASKYTITFKNTGLSKLYKDDAKEATVKVVVKEYKDTLKPANMGVKVEKNLVMKKDTVKPALKGSLVYKAADQTLTANLTKNVADAAATDLAAKMYVLDPTTGVRYDVVDTAAAGALSVAALEAEADTDADTVNDKIVLTNGDSTKAALENGNYQLVIEAEAVEDLSFGKNKNDKIVAEFTVTGVASKDKPEVASVDYASDNNTIKVTYKTAKVDKTATNPSNYKLNGKALPSGTVITLNAAKTVATIVIPEGTFEKTENQVLTIENVKSIDGVVMDKHEEVFKVNDNTQPRMKSAKLVDGDIIVTFNEDVDTTTVTGGQAFVDGDFKITLNGAVLTATTNYTVVDANTDAKLDKNQVKISPVSATGINFTTAETLTIEIDENAGMKDAKGNAVVAGPKTKITIK